MAALSKTGKGASESKESISKLKLKLGSLRQELAKVERLIEIARPAKLPELKPASTAAPTASKLGKFSGIMVGKRKGGGISSTLRVLAAPTHPKPAAPNSVDEKHFESDQMEVSVKEKAPPAVADVTHHDEVPAKVDASPATEAPEVKDKKAFGMKLQPVRKPELAKKPVKPVMKRSSDEHDVPMHHEEEEEVWVPPAGQTGDGRTALNDKFGY